MPGFKVVGKVEAEVRFDALLEAVAVRTAGALDAWGEVAKAKIEEHETRVGDASPTRRVSPGVHLRDSFRVSQGFQGLRGLVAGDTLARGLYLIVYTPDVNAIWQELGTRGRRRRKLKEPDRGKVSRAKGTGVKPLYFMRNGLRDAYPEGVRLIQEALDDLGSVHGGATLVGTTGH